MSGHRLADACHAGAVIEDAATQDNSSPTYPLQLIGGVNFTTWPDLKWSRGNYHAAILQARFNEWHASAPVSIEPVLSEDCLRIDLVARLPRGIPKHEWSLDLGDAIHNMRSAFDAVAWGMAHFDGAEPARPKSVTFPICADEKQWKTALNNWVSGIRPELQERLLHVQPFSYLSSGQRSPLEVLHDLDIHDKHRDTLTVSADLDGLSFGGAFEYEDPTGQALPRMQMNPGQKLTDGAVLGTMHTGARVRSHGQMILRPATKIQIAYRDTTYDAIPLLHELVTTTRQLLDLLMTGPAPSDEPGDGWTDMDVDNGSA